MDMYRTGLRKCFGFTGQGSQWVGMGRSLVQKYPELLKVIEEVNSVLGYDLSTVMFEGSEVCSGKII